MDQLSFCLSVLFDHKISKVSCYLILEINSVQHNGNFIKDIKKVQCNENLPLPVALDDVSFHKKFNIITTVIRIATLDGGHYTAYFKLPNAGLSVMMQLF